MTAPSATRVIRNAAVWTDGRLVAGADAIAMGEGRILAVGRFDDFGALAASAEVIDAGGTTVTPGLTDAHLHLLAWARSLDELALAEAVSPGDAARRLAAFAAARPGPEALVGRGWDDNRWDTPPHRVLLDAVVADRPVLLHSHDFHALWVNSAALRKAGITRATPDPEGGKLERDAAGEPTGVLREHAVRLVSALAPRDDEAVDRERLARAAALLHALGITSVHVFEGSRARRLLRELAAQRHGLRVLMHLTHASLEAALAAGVKSGVGDTRFRIGAIKLFADGTLGSRTAAVFAPYAGSDSLGMELIAPAELDRLIARAAEGGLASAVHAIGDRAVASALDAFERCAAARRANGVTARIEHVQLAREEDLGRFAALDVWASLQPTHAISDIATAERYWEGRLDRTYPWQSLLARGARFAFGSDAPVEPPDPSRTLHAAVTRERIDGTPRGGWDARQRITLDAALSASCEGPAQLAGNWPQVGSLAVGSEADVVLWDRDLHRSDPQELFEARPAFTLLAGETVYALGEAGPGSAAGNVKTRGIPATAPRGAAA